MGCGKSSVGRKLSQLLCCPFMDLDDDIEAAAGKSIPEIFAQDGEEAFRRIEAERLRTVLDSDTEMVLSLGGGTVTRAECAEMVKGKTFCVYLKATTDTLVSHLEGETAHRPMLQGGSLIEKISALMSLRSGIYEDTAHVIVDTDGKSIDEIATAIMDLTR